MGVDRSRVRGWRWCGGEERHRRSAVADDVAPGKEEILIKVEAAHEGVWRRRGRGL
jgi:hypothetical protein